MIHLETVHDGERQHLARLIARVRRQHHGFGRHLQQALRNRSLEFRATDFLDFFAFLLTIPMTNIVPGSSNSYELVSSQLVRYSLLGHRTQGTMVSVFSSYPAS